MRKQKAFLAASLVLLLLGTSAWQCGRAEKAEEPTVAPLATPTSTPTPTATPRPPVTATPIIYVVQPGDTLAGIAVLYGTTAEAICSFNHLEDCSLIYPGDELQIPGEEVVLPSPTVLAEVASPTPATAPLPPPQDLGAVSAEGNAELEVVNDTPYELTLEFEGPTSHTVTIERCPECKEYYFVGPFTCPSGRPKATFRLPPGSYQVTARIDKPGITPFAGTWELAGDRLYGYCFYIVSQFQ